MIRRLSLAPAARADIVDILEWSTRYFGLDISEGYEALIMAALERIVGEPMVPGSLERTDLADGIRTLHLRTCRHWVSPTARHIASPRHFVIYREHGDSVQVIRLLHEAMDVTAIDFAI